MSDLHPAFTETEYLFRKKVLKIFGGAFHIYDTGGRVVMYGKQKAFRFREDMRVSTDESEREELLRIKTPQILDIGATYGVLDATRDEMVGAIRRRALKSILRDEYVLVGQGGDEIGKLTERSAWGALASRFLNLIPQRYVIQDSAGQVQATFRQHFNPFVLRYSLSFENPDPTIDRRLVIAAGILLCAVERRQQS